MNMSDEKERNERIEKLIRMLSEGGTHLKNRDLKTILDDEHCHNRHQTEEDYQKEQAAWLKRVSIRKNKAGCP